MIRVSGIRVSLDVDFFDLKALAAGKLKIPQDRIKSVRLLKKIS